MLCKKLLFVFYVNQNIHLYLNHYVPSQMYVLRF